MYCSHGSVLHANYLYVCLFCADKLVVSTSCSLLHTAVDLVNETKLDDEIKSWLAFAAQKVVEVNALAKALAGQKDEVLNVSIRILYSGIIGNLLCIVTCNFNDVDTMSSFNFWWFYLQAYFAANAAAQASRRSSPRVTNEAVQKAVCI